MTSASTKTTASAFQGFEKLRLCADRTCSYLVEIRVRERLSIDLMQLRKPLRKKKGRWSKSKRPFVIRWQPIRDNVRNFLLSAPAEMLGIFQQLLELLIGPENCAVGFYLITRRKDL